MFKSKSKLAKAFHVKDCIPNELTSGVVYKFKCGLCSESYYGKCVRHLNARIEEHIGMSPWTKKKVKDSALSDHLLLCNHSPSFKKFIVLPKENEKIPIRIERKFPNNETQRFFKQKKIDLHRYTYLANYSFTPLLGSLIL